MMMTRSGKPTVPGGAKSARNWIYCPLLKLRPYAHFYPHLLRYKRSNRSELATTFRGVRETPEFSPRL